MLRCLSGRLTVEDCELRGPGKEGACVRTDQGTEVTMRASQVRTGPVYLTGASGVLEDRTLLGSRANAGWARQGGALRISGGAISDSPGHAVRANGAAVDIAHCTISGTGSSALAVADDSRLTLADSVLRDAHKSGVDVMRQSTAELSGCTVERCERSVRVTDGSTARLSGTTMADARISSLTVRSQSRVEVADCVSRAAVRYGVFVGGGGVLTARQLRLEGGELGLWLSEGRSEVTGLRLSGADAGCRAGQTMTARIEDARLTGCGQGVDVPTGRAPLELSDTAIEEPPRGHQPGRGGAAVRPAVHGHRRARPRCPAGRVGPARRAGADGTGRRRRGRPGHRDGAGDAARVRPGRERGRRSALAPALTRGVDRGSAAA